NKEEEILYPTSLKLITEDEFKEMRAGDDEIGYCLIDKPEGFYPEKKENKFENQHIQKNKSEFMNDLANLLSKYNIGENNVGKDKNEVFDVKQGKLTLEQINLIFRHMPVDLSFVDENEIVKFYTDTKHRVFPRSAGVIGRDVKNCHPRESVSTVQEIIEAFRKGEQDETDFWLEMNGKFIYINYVAVRNEKGEFKGVLEMMQDVTKIRSLTGNRKLLTWESSAKKVQEKDKNTQSEKTENISEFGFYEKSVIGDIIDKYPYIKEFMPTLAPEYTKLLDPVQYMIMSKVATLDMIAERGGFEVSELIGKIEGRIKRENNKSEEKYVGENKYGLTEKSVIGDIIDKYPYIKEFMPTLSPVYKRLLNPVQYMIMSKVATLDMIAERGGFEVSELIKKIEEKITEEE
ncbi:MAG: PAS domain-containing protein, partial [Leptotrichiaceae bacterium]|nr:PAS domain-containing protein [Leptotrichiaceae bacterium]